MWYIGKVELKLYDSEISTPKYGSIVTDPFQAVYTMTLVNSDTNEHLNVLLSCLDNIKEELRRMLEKYNPLGVFKTGSNEFSFLCVDKFSIRLIDFIDAIEQIQIDYTHPLYAKLCQASVRFRPVDDFRFFYSYQTFDDVASKTGYCSLFHIMRHFGNMQYDNEYYIRISAPKRDRISVCRVRFTDPQVAWTFVSKSMIGSLNALKNMMNASY